MHAVIVAVICLVLLGLNELWWRGRRKPDELSRKFVHIVAGCFVATWPYFLSWNEIRALSLLALMIVVVSKYFKLFQMIHTVIRPTWGEVCFALAVGLTTFITHTKGIYAAAVLQMALADGLAGVAGMRYGKPYGYKVLGHTKSLVGTGTFLFVSYAILLSLSVFSMPIAIGWCLLIALLATALENVSVKGLDNLTVPLAVAVLLRLVA